MSCCKVLVFGWLRQHYWGCPSLQHTASLAPRSALHWLHMELVEFSGTNSQWLVSKTVPFPLLFYVMPLLLLFLIIIIIIIIIIKYTDIVQGLNNAASVLLVFCSFDSACLANCRFVFAKHTCGLWPLLPVPCSVLVCYSSALLRFSCNKLN